MPESAMMAKTNSNDMHKKIKIIFMGTPDFALPSLQGLLKDEDFEVLAAVTQEDKKIGRKQELTPPPVKQLAQKYNVPVFQPPDVTNDEFILLLSNLKPDIIVVVAYGKILPQKILQLPAYGAVNVHASLLPKYRGASPIEASLLNGDEETGVTIMKMVQKLDAGDILDVAKLKIETSDNAETLTTKLSLLGGKLLPYVLKDLAEDEIHPIPQDEGKATFCHKITKEDGLIDLKTSTALEIHNKIRAYTPWPSVYFFLDGKRFKILEAKVDENLQLQPGAFRELSKSSIAIGTKKGSIIPEKIQIEGKNAMTVQEFLAGNRSLLSKLLTNPK